MTKLYAELARVYHEMYQSIFDYGKEFRIYDGLLRKYGCRSVLEIGCGSGELSPYFREADYGYAGLDLSDDMLRIARREHPGAEFIQGDMRRFSLGRAFDSVLITGRSFSHLITNKDVLNALKSVHAVLKDKGVLIFDCFRAEELILNPQKESVQEVKRGDTRYRRLNRASLNLKTGWTFHWEAEYRIEKKGRKERIVKDKTVLRAFTEDEARLFLRLTGFDVLESHRGKVYVFVARRDDRPTDGKTPVVSATGSRS
jgi:SAM-dependent methyltransferase